jgi:hypothetical protein
MNRPPVCRPGCFMHSSAQTKLPGASDLLSCSYLAFATSSRTSEHTRRASNPCSIIRHPEWPIQGEPVRWGAKHTSRSSILVGLTPSRMIAAGKSRSLSKPCGESFWRVRTWHREGEGCFQQKSTPRAPLRFGPRAAWVPCTSQRSKICEAE